MANRLKIDTRMAAGKIHAILADTENFESYARLESFYDLNDIFTDKELAESGYYAYLQDGDGSHIFQGYPEETVIGIPASVKDPQIVLKFLEYLMD